jgi:hypothetical protein
VRVGWPATRGKRIAFVSGVGVVVLFVAWMIVGYLVIVDPTVNHPEHADAVVVLGPPQVNGRLDVARQLIAQHVSTQLVVSLNSPKQWQARELCAHPPAGVTVTCFKPEPSTTRGEAEHLRDLARQHGWHSIIVVTSTYHVSRARMIFDRCIDGRVDLVAARHHIGPLNWAYEYFYQTGAYVKAALQSGC